MEKDQQKKSHPDDQKYDDFQVMTKMPPQHVAPNHHQGSPPHHLGSYSSSNNAPHLTHKNYQPVSWDTCFDQLSFLDDGTSVYRAGHDGALFFCIHGAGHSALSFATLARQVKHFGTLIAFDFKGHGRSKKKYDEDMSIETLCSQAIEVLKQLMQKYNQKNIVVVGHSMGGSVAARIVDTLTNIQNQPRIVGCVIIDVVEGTAIQALPFMNQILSDRPKYFESLESAIKWSISSNTLRKLESAKISIPAQLIEVDVQDTKKYTWKINLKETQKFWLGWFKGLSKCFLGIHIPKILVTAEKQRMDKQLTIAQMQGKFKLTVLHNVGHSVQEDNQKDSARMLYDFLNDFRIPTTLSEVAEKQLVGIAKFHPKLSEY